MAITYWLLIISFICLTLRYANIWHLSPQNVSHLTNFLLLPSFLHENKYLYSNVYVVCPYKVNCNTFFHLTKVAGQLAAQSFNTPLHLLSHNSSLAISQKIKQSKNLFSQLSKHLWILLLMMNASTSSLECNIMTRLRIVITFTGKVIWDQKKKNKQLETRIECPSSSSSLYKNNDFTAAFPLSLRSQWNTKMK